MSPGPGPRSRELDDDSLLRIFSKVGCARELAKLSLVCKRWGDLSCEVSHLSFVLDAATRKELRSNEAIVSSVLCRASMRAPGNLKHLRVSLHCQHEHEVHGHWLQWTTSLTKLELTLSSSLQWGPGVWNSIVRMKTLEAVTIGGNFSIEKHLLLPRVLANGLGMPRLQYCNISCNISMLETILATCPELIELRVNTADEMTGSLRVASNRLKIFKLFGDNSDGFDATVHAPNLTTLKLFTGSELTSIYFESAQSLQTLYLESSYKLYSPPENLQKLKLEGEFDIQEFPQMLKLTPMITDLYLKNVGITGGGRIDIDHIVAPLVNLRNIYLGCEVISQFQTGKKRFEALNVHLWPGSSTPEVCLLIQLIEDHKIQSLVVHCKHMFDCRTKAIIKSYEEWRFLFDLSYFYPDRVKLVS